MDDSKKEDNLGVKNLDESTRKDLFNKLVKAEDDLQKDGNRIAASNSGRKKQDGYKQKTDQHKKRTKSRTSPPARAKVVPKRTIVNKKKSKNIKAKFSQSLEKFYHRFLIHFKLGLLGVTDFSGLQFKKKYLEKFNLEYKISIMRVQTLFLNLFKQAPGISSQIIDELDSMNTLYYNLIEKMSYTYDKDELSLIIKHYLQSPDAAQNVSEIEPPLTSLFRKLYILNPYKNLTLTAYEKSLQFRMKFNKEKLPADIEDRKKLRNDFSIIFNKLFPTLYWLFCNFQGRIIPLGSPEMEKILGINKEDKPGMRNRIEKIFSTDQQVQEEGEGAVQEENEEAANKEAEDKSEQEEISDDIKAGLRLFSQLDYKKIRELYDKSNLYKDINDNDKVLLIFLLFNEFDREYSIMLTTNKIQYNVDYRDHGKDTYQEKFARIYNDLRKCTAHFEEYANVTSIFNKTRKQKPSSERYVEFTKRLTVLENRRIQRWGLLRMAVKSIMDNVAKEFEILISDMDGENKIFEDPQSILSFETGIEGKKKLNKKTIYEAITRTYQFAIAFAYRLGPRGDLLGELEFSESDKKDARSKAVEISNGDSKSNESIQEQKEVESKSIVDELDEFL